jgi:hypothetical protein
MIENIEEVEKKALRNATVLDLIGGDGENLMSSPVRAR